MNIKYKIKDNKIELYFDEKPKEHIRIMLKSLKWRWDNNQKCWKHRNTIDNLTFVKNLQLELNNSLVNSSFNNTTSIDNSINDNPLEVKKTKILFSDELRRVICFYTKYRTNDIFIGNMSNISCCNGIKLKSFKRLVDIKSGDNTLSIKGYTCPRCHRLYFSTDEIKRKKQYISYLDMPFKTIDIGYYNDNVFIELDSVIDDDNITYSEKYKKNIKFFIFMRCFVYQKRLKDVSSILSKYGYSLDTINDLYDCARLNEELFDFFEVNDMEQLCTISKTKMIDSMHYIMKNDTLSSVAYEKKVKDEKHYIVFEYNVTDKMTALFKISCNIVTAKNGIKEYKVLSDSIKAYLKYKYSNTMFVYPLENDNEGISVLISKDKYKDFCDSLNNKEKESTIPGEIKILKTADFLVRSTNYGCVNNRHNLIRINAAVRVKNSKGIYEVQIPAAYCAKCNRYYILERYYNSLKIYGYICCKVDKFETLQKISDNMFSAFQDKSILALYGYNVNKDEDLSDCERHEILDFIIDNGKRTKYEVISHLENLITLRKNNPSMKDAIKKWEKDISYVSQKQEVNAVVKVDSIAVPVKRIVLH